MQLISVALDDTPEAARPWVEEAGELSYPIVLDANHRVAELFGVINIPATVWFDESGDMVRPPQIAPGDDRFKQYTGIDADVHHNALRKWVHEGEIDSSLMQRWSQPDAQDSSLARAHRRIGAWLHRTGHDELALSHLEEAARLAPFDWTIRRGSMPLKGEDPFGQPLFTFWQEWDAAGKPGYGR